LKTTGALVFLLVAGLVSVGGGSAVAGTSSVGFGTPQYVDQQLAGGEPEVIADTLHGTLVYSSHEGTTHVYRDGVVTSPWGSFDFVANYCNQVNTWYSTDGGVNWIRDAYLGSQCPTSPAENTGFSDPDLTIDSSGRLYNTGIDLVNDALFSSKDGGKTWDKGTPYCHNGDRPWLAGGGGGEVFMTTDAAEDQVNRRMFRSTDGGKTCTVNGIPDYGTTAEGGTYTGFGKLYFDKAKTRLAEPAVYMDASGNQNGLGVSTWTRGDKKFTPHFVTHVKVIGFFPVIAVDPNNTIYMVWTPDARKAGTHGGCGGAATPAPNSVKLTYSKDWGRTWSPPTAIFHPQSARALWPWVITGDPGKLSVVWYQTGTGELADNDCQTAHIRIKEATVLSANTLKPMVSVVDAAGRPIHFGTVCQGGTTCVVTGKDRRLGDYFTNALDARGCVMIATADTMLKDPLTGSDYPTSRPLFLRQNAGPALRGTRSCG
jgi:hypothetical protein